MLSLVVSHNQGYMRDCGTYKEQDILFASVGGLVERVNKLISVTQVKTRYSRLDAVLMLSSVNLPGGVEEEVGGGRADE